MLALNLARIRTAEEHFEHTYAPEALAGDADDFRIAAPVDLVFDIFKDKDQFRLVGRATTTLELQCGRCLDPFPWPIDAGFDLRYQPHRLNAGDGEREVEEEDLTTAYYENDTIDLGQLMREQLYLLLPMKPLCGDRCLGLCPVCGTSLNKTTCGCAREWEDPRFAALRAIKRES